MKGKWILLSMLVLGLLLIHDAHLGSTHQTASARMPTLTNASTAPTGVVFVGNNVVDLKWSCESGCNPLFMRDGSEIKSGQDFYRDTGVSKGVSYVYDLCCVCDSVPTCDQRQISTGEVQGDLYRSLDWGTGIYILHGDVRVWQGATMNINGSTVDSASQVDLKAIESKGHGETADYPGGDIRVFGATFYPFTGLTFSSQGENYLKASTMQGYTTTREILLTDMAEVQISDNNFDLVEINVEDQAKLTAFSNEFNDCHILARGAQPDMSIIANHFYDAEQTMTIEQRGGNSKIFGNHFHQSTYEYSKTAIWVNGWDSPATAQISYNALGSWNRGIGLFEGSQAAVNDNLISYSDTGIFVRYDASVQMEGNTISKNETGIEVWDSPEVGIHQSCITGNIDYGLSAHSDQTSVDASENWWGHDSGPLSEENPFGLGDRASGNNTTVTPWLTETNCTKSMVSTIITATGGTIQSSDGKISLEVPPDAVPEGTLFGILWMAVFSIGDAKKADQIMINFVEISSYIISDKKAALTTKNLLDDVANINEATLSIKYDAEEVASIDEASLALYTHQEGGGSTKSSSPAGFEDEWIRLPTSQVDLENNLVTATIDELGTFALIGDLADHNIYLPFVFSP